MALPKGGWLNVGTGGAFLVCDALGLAHPLTAEGNLPAVLSGRVCGEAILDGAGQSYGARLVLHPTFRDYALTRGLPRAIVARLSAPPRRPGPVARAATAGAYAWMLGGRPLPAGRLLGAALRVGGRAA
jgi:hypothetical protein